ncbi:tyrosine--tRNA ligase, mitochondrial-like [Zophobas morio]|uniref:tyrosine--tRNA ligase, mitochondrial-like n=1 Tax=Zophobas morio TaxID=2755281 RepID=UPI003083D4CF
MVTLITLVHFMKFGHKPIIVIGGATGRLGDPSWRTSERLDLQEKVLLENITGIRRDIANFFNNSMNFVKTKNLIVKNTEGGGQNCAYSNNMGSDISFPEELKILNNYDWYTNFNPISFLSLVGKHFRLSNMLARECIKTRLFVGEGATLSELCYQVFQAYDFLHLFCTHQCEFQIGGDDQFGNIVGGTELVRKVTGYSVHGVTNPLLTNKNGEKLGKSAGNSIWLNAEKTSPYYFYQYFLNVSDDEVEYLLKVLTLLPLDEIQFIVKAHLAEPEKRLAQQALSEHLTFLVHGGRGLRQAKSVTSILFSGNLENLSVDELRTVFKCFPTVFLPKELLQRPLTVLDLAPRMNLSKGAVRRLLASKGLYLNNKTVNSANPQVTTRDLLHHQFTIIRIGRKNFYFFEWS